MPAFTLPMARRLAPRWHRWLWWGGAALMLALTTSLYFNPLFMVQVSDLVWACFG